MHRPVSLLTTCVAALVAAAPAAAQAPVPPPPPGTTPAPAPAPSPAPAPAPAPAAGALSIKLERVNGKAAAVLAGTRFRVRGTVKPYVAGQRVTVRVYRGERKVAARRVTVAPVKGGARGTLVHDFEFRLPGHLTVRASHRATAQQATMVARGRGLDVLPLRARPGTTGLAVRLLQQRLARLGYVVGRRGVFDGRTARAVLAFRKVTGMARTIEASEEVFRRLARGQGAFKVRYPGHGKHVEADLSRQVLVFARGAKVERIYHISSGAPGTPTILGSFRVYMKTPGTNAKGMVFSSYFIRGYAIHGYASVPVFNASHGCLRVPVPDAVSIYNWVQMGDRVDVYP
ncbi:MAG: murein L,D-transpeptidase [Solirubrobacterales bacterium]|nr:murein L,D-transpeptidase [Solirubrobacterales bacterium]